jgi:hypothetical protein
LDPRIILRIELTSAAKNHLNDFTERAGMTQVATLSRLVEWFANQPDVVQRLIVGHIPKEMQQDVARLMLKNLSKA